MISRTILTAAAAALMTAAACGGSPGNGGNPTTPTPTPTPGAATITITASGVSPRSVTISAGSRVTFVNNDSRVHDMASDPHPAHSACPAINDVGFVQPGQSRTTGNLTTPRTCTYHDHNRDTDTSLQGSIIIQ